MSRQYFTPELKEKAVRRVPQRGYSVAEVADTAVGYTDIDGKVQLIHALVSGIPDPPLLGHFPARPEVFGVPLKRAA